MTFAWLLVGGSVIPTTCFLLLGLFGGLAYNSSTPHIPTLAYPRHRRRGRRLACHRLAHPHGDLPDDCLSAGDGYQHDHRGLANFAVTLLTPIMFSDLEYWIFLIFAATNTIAGVWIYVCLPESGGRSFQENQGFFDDAKEAGTWQVNKVKGGMLTKLPYGGEPRAETTPLLSRVEDQLP